MPLCGAATGPGREFECKVNGVGDGNRSGHAWVKVKIKDDQGDLSLG
ncbi:hypothetical protein [Streptomyces bluensis]|uniref:Ig-like domain-containing protein n=1 Tax=Streptomyces bluensis TaxID=33897 RepID=A0ABW6UIT7_9ACTN